MTDEDIDGADARRIGTVLEQIDREELSNLLVDGLEQLIEEPTNTGGTIDGPDDETQYYLVRDRLPSDRYHDCSRTITEAVLDVSPRTVAAVEVDGIADFLRDRDEAAVETLLENGISFRSSEHNDGSIEGRCDATPTVVDAVLALYTPGLWEAHFLDGDGTAIAARFDDTLQYYWLPESAYAKLGERLDPDRFAALVGPDELERIHERKCAND